MLATGCAENVIITGKSFINSLGVSSMENVEKLYKAKAAYEAEDYFDFPGIEIKNGKRVDTEIWNDMSDLPVSFKRIPDSTKFALYAVQQALKDASIVIDENNSQRVGLFYATGLAAIGDVEKFLNPVCISGIEKGSPLKFPDTTSAVGCGRVCIENNITGKALAISTGGVAGIQCIDMAIDALNDKEIDLAVIVGTDELTDSVFKAFYYTKMLGHKQREYIQPYTQEKGNTTILGEGAAAIVLQRSSVEKREENKKYCICRSIRMGTDLDSTGKILSGLIKRNLEDCELDVEDIDLIIGAANGNSKLDQIELQGIRDVFQKELPYIFLPSIYFGEMDGASSITGLICGLDMMEKQQKMKAPDYFERTLKDLNISSGDNKEIKNVLLVANSYYGDVASMIISK